MKLSTLIIVFAILALSLEAAAVSFNIIVVEGSKKGTSYSQSLAAYKKQLGDMGYSSCKQISAQGFSLEKGKSKPFKVAGNVSAEIKPTSVADGFIHFDLRMTQGGNEVLKINYRISDGGHTIIAGPFSGQTRYIIIIKASQ